MPTFENTEESNNKNHDSRGQKLHNFNIEEYYYLL